LISRISRRLISDNFEYKLILGQVEIIAYTFIRAKKNVSRNRQTVKHQTNDQLQYPQATHHHLDGDKMADQEPFYLFKELRLNLEPACLDSVVTVRLPPHGQLSKTSQRRVKPSELPPAEDEGAFAEKYLASSSSIYFRRNQKYPRSFLWRVLDDGKTLSIQSVDLSKSTKSTAGASLILRLAFTNTIRPAGVVLSDSKEHEHFNVFVLTSSDGLYTFTLRPEFFTRASAIEANVSFWCKIFLPSSFSFRYPHRLVAINPLELLISLHDGGVLKLSRKQEDDGMISVLLESEVYG
jgi:nuclear pore complex protein Nup160